MFPNFQSLLFQEVRVEMGPVGPAGVLRGIWDRFVTEGSEKASQKNQHPTHTSLVGVEESPN
jgi:hypothetical protein